MIIVTKENNPELYNVLFPEEKTNKKTFELTIDCIRSQHCVMDKEDIYNWILDDEKKIETLKQALNEIKEYIKDNDCGGYCDDLDHSYILQIINKVLGGENAKNKK